LRSTCTCGTRARPPTRWGKRRLCAAIHVVAVNIRAHMILETAQLILNQVHQHQPSGRVDS
jgi:hypothetical protein